MKPGEMMEEKVWTRFMDMHSGGGCKEPPYEYVYIEAGEEEAKVIFYNRFGHNPERVTCTCCGEDYSISESATLEDLTGFERGCKFDSTSGLYVEKPDPRAFSSNPFVTLNAFSQRKDVLVIRSKDIKPDERVGDLPRQGYVWVD